jgi:hypothetical protein
MATRPYAPQPLVDPQLASIELHTHQPGPGEPWPVSVDLVCRPAWIEGVRIAVRRGRLYISCGDAHAGELKDRKGFPGGFRYLRGACEITLWPGGTSQLAVWDVEADPGPIGSLSLDEFCLIFDLAPDDTIVGSFSAYIKDLDLAHESDGDGSAAPPEDSISFMRPDFQKLGSKAKQAVLKRLTAMNLPGGDDGWAHLCRAAIQFKEIGNAGHDQQSEN